MKPSPPMETFSTKMMRFIKKQCILGLISVVVLVVGCLLFIDSKISPVAVQLPEAPQLVGALSVNERLRSARVLHYRQLRGCESLVRVDDSIFCGTVDSRLVQFNDTAIISEVKLGNGSCRSISECGRCLGLRLDPHRSRLLFVDAYHGLFSRDLRSGMIQRLFPRDGDSFHVTSFNDLALLPSGAVVISESSTKYPIHQMVSAVMEGRATGRLLLVEPDTGRHRVLMDGLHFPNGVQVHSEDPGVVLVVETMKARLLAVTVGQLSPVEQRAKVFADNLPGFPDNIRTSPSRGGYWVSFASVRHSGNAYIADLVMTYPFMRSCLKKFFSDPVLHLMMTTGHGILVRYDEAGNVAESLHDPRGLNVTTSSEALEVDGSLYLGNYYLSYIVKVDL